MQPTIPKDIYGQPARSLVVGQFMSKVYLWMTLGLMLTGFVSYIVSTNENLLYMIASNKILFWGLIIAQFGLVMFLSAGLNKINALTATSMFLLYAVLNGVTLSLFSLIYTQESIVSAFFTSATAFAGLSAFGFFTKRDLGPVGNFCTMGLFGLMGFAILSIFFPSMMGTMGSQIYGLVGIIVFAGLTAYDTQIIKNMAPTGGDSETHRKGAIMGALKLYLDFINLFLFILRMQGRRK